MTAARATVGERATRCGDEAPAVALWLEVELQDPEARVAADLAVGLDGAELAQACPAGADHELPDALHRVRPAIGVLRSKALVVVVVAVEDDLGAGPVQGIPDGVEPLVVAVPA